MTQTVVPKIEYGVPNVEEKTHKSASGVLKILSYSSGRLDGSVPGSSGSRSYQVTEMKIGEQPVSFPGHIGFEMNRQDVVYKYVERTTKTFFDPSGRENDPSYRRGKVEHELVHILSAPSGSLLSLPTYEVKERSVYSM